MTASRWAGLACTIALVTLGLAFLALDILDINEEFRVFLNISLLNTVFLSSVAGITAFLAGKEFVAGGSSKVLWMGCGSLALGAGALLRAWLPGQDLAALITINEFSVLLASAMHLTAVSQGKARVSPRWRVAATGFSYLGALGLVALTAVVTLKTGIVSLYIPEWGSTAPRDILRGIIVMLFLASFLVSMIGFLRSRSGLEYWYSLGLMLMGFGVAFMAQGALESRIGWLGRTSLYAGGLYVLIAVLQTQGHGSAAEVGSKP